MVGTSGKQHGLKELPIRLMLMDTAVQAIRCLREESIDTLISKWHLVDIPDGKLLANTVAAVPSMPTIALIEPGNYEQEIEAARLGATAILSEDIDDNHFRQVVCQLLHISKVAEMRVPDDLELVSH
jgi:DNA-binding NtrC family response regulator